MNFLNPKDITIIKDIPPVVDKSARISLDVEMFGMDKKKLHRNTTGHFASMQITFDGKTVYFIQDQNQIAQALKNIDAGVIIGHNLKFDITQLRRYAEFPQRKRLWDTMLVSQIQWSGYYNDFSLADECRRRLDIFLDKSQQKSFEQSDFMSQEQIEYSCLDAVATWLVYKHQRAEISETDLNIWKNIELPFLWTILSMSGTKLDTKAWMELAERNKKSAEEIQAKYPDINLNSPAQVKNKMKEDGHKVDSTDEEHLAKLSNEYEFAKDMLEYRMVAKRSSTYGEKFITDHVENDGRIYADIYQIGAETGRTSCRAPNLQNQPNEDEFRQCFVADEGNCMVVADWSSQEPRIAAFLSQDERLISVFNSGKDIYIEIAKDVLGETITKKDPRRKTIKSLVLGIFYGMSAYGLAQRLEIDEGTAQGMIDKFLDAYPNVKNYMIQQRKAKDYVQSIYGRKIWLNHWTNQWERGALNYPIQSSAADALKSAAYQFVKEWSGDNFYTKTPLELMIHDEICIEIPKDKCNAARECLLNSMVSVTNKLHPGIKGMAEVYAGNSWGCKK